MDNLINSDENSSPSENLINQAKENENKSPGFMTPKGPKKETRGRKPLSEEEKARRAEERKSGLKKEGPQSDNADSKKVDNSAENKLICYALVKAISAGGVAITKDKRASIGPEEAETMAQAIEPLINKYLPDLLSKYGAEAAFALAMGQYGMKLYAVTQLQKEEMKERGPITPKGPDIRPEPENTGAVMPEIVP